MEDLSNMKDRDRETETEGRQAGRKERMAADMMGLFSFSLILQQIDSVSGHGFLFTLCGVCLAS